MVTITGCTEYKYLGSIFTTTEETPKIYALWTRQIQYWIREPENNSFGMDMSRELTRHDYQKYD
jgi:hypothetical protein